MVFGLPLACSALARVGVSDERFSHLAARVELLEERINQIQGSNSFDNVGK